MPIKDPAKTDAELKQKLTHAEVERLRELRDLMEVMSTVAGRRFIWKLLANTNVFHNPFIPKSLEMYWRGGRRSVGLEIYNDVLEGCKDLFWKAQMENIKKPQEVKNG